MSGIKKLISFIEHDKNRSLIINQVSEEIGAFYFISLSYFTKKFDIKVNFDPSIEGTNKSEDLFGTEEICLYKMPNTKQIEKILKLNEKKIIITDYKNYKKCQSFVENINGYNYISDIKYFLGDVLKIKDTNFIEYCIAYPQLVYSEFSKYLVNDEGYSKDSYITQQTNFILNIRKKIFTHKQSNDIKNIFLKIKEEAHYKKFSFLTY